MVERRLETVHELVSIPENNQQCLAIASKGRSDYCQEEAEIRRDLTRKHSGESEGNANNPLLLSFLFLNGLCEKFVHLLIP